MYKKISITVLLISITFLSYAQKENSNWFFGYNAALTWKNTTSYAATGV